MLNNIAWLHWITNILKILSKNFAYRPLGREVYFTKRPKNGVEGKLEHNVTVADWLEKMQCPVVEYLTYKLQDNNGLMRCIAADALGNIEDARGVKGLAQALNDPDLSVRIAATRSLWKLGKAGNPEAFAALRSS